MENIQFFTKTIGWSDANGGYHMNKIILQNGNGPCFFIALTNTLIMMQELADSNGWHVVKSGRNGPTDSSNDKTNQIKSLDIEELKKLIGARDTVTLESLLSCLTDVIFNIDGSETSIDLDLILNLLPKLGTGLNVNLDMGNARIEEFGHDTKAVNQLLNVFDISIVHGFLMDESKRLKWAKMVGLNDKDFTFDKIQEVMVKTLEDNPEMNKDSKDVNINGYYELKQFFEDNKTQLTEEGLTKISNDNILLPLNGFAIFFRNDHFSTLYKNGTGVYLLVSDAGFKDEPEIVWQRLSDIDGTADEFMTGDFTLSSPKNSAEHNETLESDELLSRQLQEEEDEKYSRNLQKKYDSENQVEEQSAASKKRKRKRNRKRKNTQQKGTEEVVASSGDREQSCVIS